MHSNGIITAPVNTDDVAAVLGVASNDVGTLCSSSQINKWAVYKPESTGGPESVTLAQRKANNFSLTPGSTCANITTFKNAVKGGTFKQGWNYSNPADSLKWLRLDDFVSDDGTLGYNHYATPPFPELKHAIAEVNDISGGGTQTVLNFQGVTSEAASKRTMVRLEDLGGSPNANDCYMGIYLYNSSRSLMATSTAKLSAGAASISFGQPGAAYAGTYNAVAFLSSAPLTISSPDTTAATIYSSGIILSSIRLVKVSEAAGVRVSAKQNFAGSNAVTLTLEAYNEMPSDIDTRRRFTIVSVHEIQAGTNADLGACTLLPSPGELTVDDDGAGSVTTTQIVMKSVANSIKVTFRGHYATIGYVESSVIGGPGLQFSPAT